MKKKTFNLSYGDYEMTHGDEIKARILKAGLELWPNVTARAIGRHLNMSHTAILYHFGSAELLQLDVARYAVAEGDASVVVQLIASGHPAAQALKPAERKRYLASMS